MHIYTRLPHGGRHERQCAQSLSQVLVSNPSRKRRSHIDVPPPKPPGGIATLLLSGMALLSGISTADVPPPQAPARIAAPLPTGTTPLFDMSLPFSIYPLLPFRYGGGSLPSGIALPSSMALPSGISINAEGSQDFVEKRKVLRNGVGAMVLETK